MKKILLLALALILAFGCTQNTNQVANTTSGNPMANTTSGNTSFSGCAAGYDWCGAQDKCLSNGQACLDVATESFPPYNYLASNGTISGQSADVVRGIMARLNETDSIQLMNWSDGYNLALSGPATALFSTERTPERENLFKWVGPIGAYDYEFYAQNGTNLTILNLDDAKKVGSICVVKDDARAQFLLQNGFTDLTYSPNDMECAGRLAAGEVDLWLGSQVSFNQTVANGGYAPVEFQPILSVKQSQMYIAFSKDTPDAEVQAWQQALDGMKADGTFDSIAASYNNAPVDPSKAAPCFMEQSDWKIQESVKLVDNELTGLTNTLQASAQTEDAISGNWSRIQPLLQNDSDKYPAAVHWYALTNGSYYTLTNGLQSATLSDRPYFPVVLGGKVSIGTVVASKSTGKNVVIVAVPIRSNGTVVGVLGSSVYLDNLSTDTADFLRVPDGVSYFAVDGTGQTVISQATEDIMSGDSLLGDAKPYVLSNQNGTISYTYAGKLHSGVFQRSPLTGWTFVLSDVPSEAGTCGS